MPLYFPNSRFSDCWSSMGNITFYHRGGKCYWRSKPYSEYPGSVAQQIYFEVHQRALAAWRTLPHETQIVWSDYAKTVTAHKPPFLKENHISGHNLFVSAYHGFATLGNEHIPVPVRFEHFPPFKAEYLSVEVIGNSDLLLRFSLFVGCNRPLKYRVLGKIQLTNPGKGCHPGKLRNFLSSETSMEEPTASQTDTREITFLIPDYKTVWNLDLPEYTLHIRYLLLDTVTGYRNLYHKLSSLVSI